jgi:2-methylisocitrate lyase-like PEP mutase family enzyme
MADIAQTRAAFRQLHEEGCFVIPNFWDAGSARILQSIGFKAVASSSAGFAWSMGRPDNGVTVEEAVAHLKAVCSAVDIPVNADFENGFADEPEAVAANAVRAAKAGVSGLSIEDLASREERKLYDDKLVAERIRAVRAALDKAAPDVMLVGRTEGLLFGALTLQQAIDRAVALAEAGADVIFVPGLRQPSDIQALVAAVAPKPVNVIGGPGMTVAQLADLGVRRISVGGSLARVALGAFMNAANQIENTGDFAILAEGTSGGRLNDLFTG